jgi:hypothetical protein
MRTIVLLNSIYSADLIAGFDYLKKNLDMKKFNIISPLMFMEKNLKYDTDNFTVRLIASAISLGNMYNEFGTIKSIADENKITIYYGLAHIHVKKEKVITINLPALDTQEFLLDKYLKEANITFNYVKSGESNLNFNKIEDFMVWLNDLQ